MRWNPCLLLLSCLVLSASAGPGAIPTDYYDGVDVTSPAALRATLNAIVTEGHDRIGYDNTWPVLKRTDVDPANAANVLLIYTGQSRAAADQCSTDCQDGDPFAGTWSREHLWPQSTFDDAEPMRSDIHALYPCDQDVNNARSNKPYNMVTTPTYTAGGSEGDSDFWEVRVQDRGNVARGLFYMDVRYEGAPGEIDLKLNDAPDGTRGLGEMGILSTLLQWHQADPPDDAERLRNSRVFDEQGNANPFVDHPEWALILYGVETGPVDGTALTVAGSDAAPGTFAAGDEIPMLSLELKASAYEWDIASIGLERLGTLTDGEIEEARLYADLDRSATVTPGDSLLASASFTGGSASLEPGGYRISSAPAALLVTLKTTASATPRGTVQVRVPANSILHSPTGGNDIDPSFAAITSGVAEVEFVPDPVDGVIITEIMYDPGSSEATPVKTEWVEILNTTGSAVELIECRLRDEDGASGAFTVTLQPYEAAVLIPADATTAGFQAAWGTGFTVIPLSPWQGLANTPSATNEILDLVDSLDRLVDRVNFERAAPWPSNASNGPSIYLLPGHLDAASNDNGANWAFSTAGVDGARVNTVTAVFGGTDTGSPGHVEGAGPTIVPGDANGDGAVTPADAQAAFDCWLADGCEAGVSPQAADLCPENGDGLVAPSDAAGILRLFLGIAPACG